MNKSGKTTVFGIFKGRKDRRTQLSQEFRLSPEDKKFAEAFNRALIDERSMELNIVLKGQYARAYELLENAVAAGLTPILVGPPGVGKSLLARAFAKDTGRTFYEVFFDELMRPAYLIGTFDPAIVLQKGYCLEAFEPGPLLRAMIEGGVFVAQELNRASEFCQNSLLEPLEERTYYVPRLGRIKAHDNFVLIATANPAELAGTHRLSEALRDRLRVWIQLVYPDRETELEIIKVNLGGYPLSEDILHKICNIVRLTRNNQYIEQPASIRAGISISRLVAQHAAAGYEITDELIADCARHVLRGAIKARALMDTETIIEGVLKVALREGGSGVGER